MEIDITQIGHTENTEDEFLSAVQRARDDERVTWVTDGGQRIAAIVPLEVGHAMNVQAPSTEGGLVLPPGSHIGRTIGGTEPEIVLADGTHMWLADWVRGQLDALSGAT